MNTFEEKLKALGVSIEDTPMLIIVQLSVLNMTSLASFKNETSESLQNLRDHYSITAIKGYDNYKTLIIYDFLENDINDPRDIQNYIMKKRNFQSLCKYLPEIRKTFFYNESETSYIELKMVNAINLAFKSFEDDGFDDQLLISVPHAKGGSNYHMDILIDKIICNNFLVIYEIFDNELSKKYYLIKKKENKENDSDAN